MKVLHLIFISLLILSCEKNFEPLVGVNVFIESDQNVYALSDTVYIYLINESNRSVYSLSPNFFGYRKYIDDSWQPLDHTVPQVIPESVEHKPGRSILTISILSESGLYRYQQYIYWDKDTKIKDGLGMLISNKFEIKSGT